MSCLPTILVLVFAATAHAQIRYGLQNLADVTQLADNLPTTFTPFPHDPGFPISAVVDKARSIPSHSWEYGAASEALLEVFHPQLSVFGETPFPLPEFKWEEVDALNYAHGKIVIGQKEDALSEGDGAVGDPASLGVYAVMLGQTEEKYKTAATAQLKYVVDDAPKDDKTGAISQRANVKEFWADFMYMAPPFIAYYAAASSNASLLHLSVTQCLAYRKILSTDSGRWKHIVGPESPDPGLWSTGNAWAAAGMSRVLATVLKSPIATNESWRPSAVGELTEAIKKVLDGAIASPLDKGLLRNYLDDTSQDHGFGEISGSALLAAVVYRMVVLSPNTFSDNKYLTWAEGIRGVLGKDKHVGEDGVVTPAVNPLMWASTEPWTTGSPEGQAFVALLYAGWRDCVSAGKCVIKEGSAASSSEAAVPTGTKRDAHQRRSRKLR